MKASVILLGCDDTTEIDLEMTEEQFEFLVNVAKSVSAASKYNCQPVMKVIEYVLMGE